MEKVSHFNEDIHAEEIWEEHFPNLGLALANIQVNGPVIKWKQLVKTKSTGQDEALKCDRINSGKMGDNFRSTLHTCIHVL